VNRQTLFTALACALLVFSMLGCGATNHLQSVNLGASLVNGVPNTTQSGFFTLEGNGGTIQLTATAVYSNGKSNLIHGQGLTYTMAVDPINNMDVFGNTLLPPCQGPCTSSAEGTAEISPTGLVTAVDPATCTWEDISSDPTKPAWFYTGAYVVTASFNGVTSQPMYIPIASSAGNQFFNGVENNPSGACGPTTTH